MRIATVQFEHRSGDRNHNLARIEALTRAAADRGAEVVAFHECCISGYTFSRSLSKEEMLDIAETVPDGPAVQALKKLATQNKVTVLAGLFEKDANGKVYNSYVCVNEKGLVARHRKLHPFINPHLSAGDAFTVFRLGDWTAGILTCYDNNVIENVRATALMGAEILFMPHVTMCTPSPRPGAGFVDTRLWDNRHSDPNSLRLEFDSMKGRAWLMKWLPARAFDNGFYVVFANAIGMDDDQVKNGCSMIVDPFGDILAECRALGDDFVVASLQRDPLIKAGGYRYKRARRPELYAEIIGQAHQAEQRVSWMKNGGTA